jgi:hypothetical protein
MTAALTLRVFTEADAGTMSAAVAGIDMVSADNAINSLGNRQAYPVMAGTCSYEKWVALRVDTAPANGCAAFKIWGDGSVAADSTFYFGVVDAASGATPVATASSVATTDFTGVTSGAKADWDTGSLTTIGQLTDFAVFQLSIDAGSAPGNWGPEVVYYCFSET